MYHSCYTCDSAGSSCWQNFTNHQLAVSKYLALADNLKSDVAHLHKPMVKKVLLPQLLI